VEALKRQEFIVVHELFMTPTARFADIILPVTHYLEKDDIGIPWTGGQYMIYMNRAVEPGPGTKSDLEIFTGISRIMGLDGYNDLDESEWMKNILKSRPTFPDLEYLKGKDIHRFEAQYPWIAFSGQIKDPENVPFPTPTGKIEIFSNRFDDMKDPFVPPIPKYIPAWEGKDDIKVKDFPLQLITPHSARRINSQLDNIDKVKRQKDDLLWMNPLDAEKRNIRDGDVVLVFNDRGRVRTKVRTTDRIMEGVVSLDEGKWYKPDRDGTDDGGNANVLTLDRMSPTGAFTSNTSLVQVEKI
jgi:anaerobic dimethyl sulfoxide reductase subunit A